ncbi:MAG: hypothetical protein ACOCVF_00105 [bacterium]
MKRPSTRIDNNLSHIDYENQLNKYIDWLEDRFLLKSVINDEPIPYETGEWDGKRTDLVLVKLADGSFNIGRLYKGYMDGSEFNDWYDQNDCELNSEVVAWSNLPF